VAVAVVPVEQVEAQLLAPAETAAQARHQVFLDRLSHMQVAAVVGVTVVHPVVGRAV
jgi:hypothetical protein